MTLPSPTRPASYRKWARIRRVGESISDPAEGRPKIETNDEQVFRIMGIGSTHGALFRPFPVLLHLGFGF